KSFLVASLRDKVLLSRRVSFREELALYFAECAFRPLAGLTEGLCHGGNLSWVRPLQRPKKSRASARPWWFMLSTVPVHPWSKESRIPILCSLEIAGRHLARLVVALQIVAELLAFNNFAHSCTLDGRDVDERISAAVVRLYEAEALG